MGRFLAGVEQRAFRIACIAVRNREDALDVVQEAMVGLARAYANSPSAEWPPLFYRILQNRIRDHQRRRKVRQKLFGWLPGVSGEAAEEGDPMESAPADERSVVEILMMNQSMHMLEQALHELPARQQEAFMLRNFEGLDVAGTAKAMRCSEGSVKTHYSRAVHALRARLGESW